MNSEKTGSASGSAGTSSRKPPSPIPEADFLARQANDAHAAMKQTLRDIARSLKDTASVRLWTQQYPKLSVTAAAAAGFAAAAALVPSAEETFKERYAELVNHLRSGPADEREASTGSWLGSLGHHIGHLAKAAAVSAASAAVTAKVQHPAEGNGDSA